MNEIGKRIRVLRKRQGRTLQDVADRCGFTRSLLSMIETGKTMPAVGTLAKIAEALGVRLSLLLGEGGGETVVLNRAKETKSKKLTPLYDGAAFFAFAAERAEKQMQPTLIELKKGIPEPRPTVHQGEEFIYVLDGRMLLWIGETEYELGPGDSIYFDSEVPHTALALTTRCRQLVIFMEPTRP
jgi:transcriptional regulator with XRE-family HTH domain